MDEHPVFRAACEYAQRGWLSARIHGLREDGKTCTCHRGPGCATPGKHPVDMGWHETATTDEDTLFDWFSGESTNNIGVVMGERSGIIDIEWDDEQGKSTAIKYGLTSIDTPTYFSHRSEHRLFRYDSRLPQQAVVKIDGLEVRIGGGARGCQSVMPPSVHASGVTYRWKLGFAPDDVEPADIPPHLMQAILERGGGEVMKPPATEILHKSAGEGERHSTMVRLLARMAIAMLDPHSPREQQDLLAVAKSLNETHCKPPLSQSEVEGIWHGQLRWAIRTRAAGGGPAHLQESLDAHIDRGGVPEADGETQTDTAYSMSGLEYRDGEWWPGRWTLRVIHGEPVYYALIVPVYRGAEAGTAEVHLTADTYMSASKVATAVLEATHTVLLNAIPEEWNQIWNGTAAKPKLGQPARRGLKAKLLDGATHEDGTAEQMRSAVLAGWLLEALTAVPEPDVDDEEETTPDPSGRPTWVKNRAGEWELWFSWSRAWEDIERRGRKTLDGERLKMRRLILEETGETEFAVGRHRSECGTSRRYILFSGKHLRSLERIAGGDSTCAASYYARTGFSKSSVGGRKSGKTVNLAGAAEKA